MLSDHYIRLLIDDCGLEGKERNRIFNSIKEMMKYLEDNEDMVATVRRTQPFKPTHFWIDDAGRTVPLMEYFESYYTYQGWESAESEFDLAKDGVLEFLEKTHLRMKPED